MANVYSEEFHEFIETYGELLDQVENARDVLEIIQEEVSSNSMTSTQRWKKL